MARSGSETRKRSSIITARFDEAEAQQIRRLADRAGVSVASLIREALLDAKPPRAVRKPSVDHAAVARVLAQLGKIGSNINQLAHYAHLGRFQESSIELALRDLSELRTACLVALGQEPDGSDDTSALAPSFNSKARKPLARA